MNGAEPQRLGLGWTKEDRRAILLIALLPLALSAPQLLGWLQANPMLYTGQLAIGLREGVLPGVPYIDPNNGFGTQALGHLAALQWLSGNVPWWNYFSGVGLPLAAEYQPGAFFPTTILLLAPGGMVLQQVALQFLSGAGTYGLLRQIGLSRYAATFGGLLYAFNGTLAWHSHASATAVPFLPWMLWGVERVYACSASAVPGGWRLLAVAMAMGLLCAFPEISFLSGLLALAWAVMRGLQCPTDHRMDYAWRIFGGGVVGIAIAGPQLLAFFHYLLNSDIGDHASYAGSLLLRPAMIPSLLEPYAFGPIFQYAWGKPLFEHIWGGIGGFVTGALLVSAAYGFWVRRDALGWLLVAWIVASLGRSFGFEPMLTVVNWIPGVTLTAFPRYAPPAWELAIIILAARGIDQIVGARVSVAQSSLVVIAAGAVALSAAVAALIAFWPELDPSEMRIAAVGSIAWLTLTLAVTVWGLSRRSPGAGRVVASLLVVEAMLMTFIPTLSNPRAGAPDFPAIHFLRNNLGMNRFYTLGPIQPNYGAYFRIASINHNYLPVSSRWVDWIRANLDSHANAVVFNGNHPRKREDPSQADELRRNLSNYQWIGVKYVVAHPNQDPLSGIEGVQRVYVDTVMSIYELPHPSSYFESEGARCRISSDDRAHLTAECSAPDRLVRRELFFPGWTARVNENEVPIALHRDLFQSIELPSGRSQVHFDYAPPHVTWAWLVALAGALALSAPSLARRLKFS